ncbi:MAG TPA: hypothetical protein VK866_00470 [Acidimicrobiales bacterium]|nr:hypothetical protein [Acidimicrobiales bacterium]
MPDWTARVAKDRAGDLAPGEELRAAIYFQGRGSAMGQITFGLASGIVGGAVGNRIAVDKRNEILGRSRSAFHTPEGSIAARVPDDKGVLAVTTARLIVFGYKQGMFSTKVEAPVVDIPIERLVGWSYTSGKVASVLNLAFDDESDVGVELPRANRPDRFAEQLAIPTTG